MKTNMIAGTTRGENSRGNAKRAMLGGAALVLGLCAFAAAPASAQEVFLGAPPPGSTVIIQEPGYVEPGYVEQGYVVAPEPRVVVREPAPRQVIVREAPERVIVTEPMGGPYANEVYVREATPGVVPPAPVGPQVVRRGLGESCQTVETESASGVIQVSEWCQ